MRVKSPPRKTRPPLRASALTGSSVTNPASGAGCGAGGGGSAADPGDAAPRPAATSAANAAAMLR
jgi:hypothetical protein